MPTPLRLDRARAAHQPGALHTVRITIVGASLSTRTSTRCRPGRSAPASWSRSGLRSPRSPCIPRLPAAGKPYWPSILEWSAAAPASSTKCSGTACPPAPTAVSPLATARLRPAATSPWGRRPALLNRAAPPTSRTAAVRCRSYELVEHVSWLIYARRRELNSPWRRLGCFKQALLVLAHLRKNETFAQVGARFGVSEATDVQCRQKASRFVVTHEPTGALRHGCGQHKHRTQSSSVMRQKLRD